MVKKNLVEESEKKRIQALVFGQKVLHKGALFRGINSQLVVPCGLFGVRLTRLNDAFVSVEVISGGLESPIRYEYKERQKVVKVKEEKKLVVEEVQQSLETEELF